MPDPEATSTEDLSAKNLSADPDSGPGADAESNVSEPATATLGEQQCAELLRDYANEFRSSPNSHEYRRFEALPTGMTILRLAPVDKIAVLLECYRHDKFEESALNRLAERLLTFKLPYTTEDIEVLANQLASKSYYFGPDKMLLVALEEWAVDHVFSEQARASLRVSRKKTQPNYHVTAREAAKLQLRLDELIGEEQVRNPIEGTEPWAKTAIAEIKAMPAERCTAWRKLLKHCLAAGSGSKTTRTWLMAAQGLVEHVSPPEFLECVARWFALVDEPRAAARTKAEHNNLRIGDCNQEILRGLAWCCTLTPEPEIVRAIGALGVSAYRQGATRLGNACVFVLGTIANDVAVAELAILKLKVKSGYAQRFVASELEKAAARFGMSREELEEMSVPTYGLAEVGVRREALGGFTAELRIDVAGNAGLYWLKADGSPQKTVPASVQENHAEELKELKAAVKEIAKMLPAQRERLDSLAVERRSWPFATWRERYLDQPLVGTLARRLIWRFRQGESTQEGVFFGGRFVGQDDRELDQLAGSTVELWHPIGSSTADIVAWRVWLEQHNVQQPFKQAHREVYLLTDAENETQTYSNRFAAHVLRQSQFRALAAARGWQTQLLGEWDGGDSNCATRRFPHLDLTAEFWVIGLPANLGLDDASSSIGLPYVSTDQVRFYRAGSPEAIPLQDVPPEIFSEVMRDVDLFVGVASVGNNPEWQDGGPDQQFVEYWTSYSWGDLSATALTRRDVLERLLPRLKIAGRCELSDRFLVVRGDWRTYKIHLGSGNVLMLPNDHYLCIVPKAGGSGESGKVFLPFEGDRMFSIILSKAFLLADDTRIKDPSIVSQIRR